jgi:hypothetical protein
VSATDPVNQVELRRYVRRVDDRWPLERALLGGARVADQQGVGAQRERGPEFVVILVSEAFDGVPWLERVHTAASLWDRSEMGDEPDVHCYTATEFERRFTTLPRLRRALEHTLDVLAPVG